MAISEIQICISKHGFIIDYKMFSDLSLGLVIELPERKIPALYTELSSILKMNAFDCKASESDDECTILMNVVFSLGTGNLVIESPAVPG